MTTLPESPGAVGVTWPDIEVTVLCGRLVPRWTAATDHPEVGWMEGRGISRAGAVRSLVREVRRARAAQADPAMRP